MNKFSEMLITKRTKRDREVKDTKREETVKETSIVMARTKEIYPTML